MERRIDLPVKGSATKGAGELPPELERHRLVDEKVYCTIRGCSLKTAQNERWRRVGVPYRKIGKSVRYAMEDILSFLAEHQKIVTRG